MIWPWNFRKFSNFYFASFLNKNFFCQAVNHAYVSKLKFDPSFSVQHVVFHCKFQIEITFDTVMLWTWNFDSSLVWTRQSISKKIFFLWRHNWKMVRQNQKNYFWRLWRPVGAWDLHIFLIWLKNVSGEFLWLPEYQNRK